MSLNLHLSDGEDGKEIYLWQTPSRRAPPRGGAMNDNNYAQYKPCVVCGVPTEWACSDCGIDSGGKRIVRVCTRPACRDFHEAEQHTCPLADDIERGEHRREEEP